jgi:hypothetical protein
LVPPPAVARALQLAEERAEKQRAAQARQEKETVAAMVARKAVLDAEAEAIKEELRKKRQLLAVGGWDGMQRAHARPLGRGGETDCWCWSCFLLKRLN